MAHQPFEAANRSSILADIRAYKINWRKQKPTPLLERFFASVFMCDISQRFGARSNTSAKGTFVNTELRSHSLLKDIQWKRIARRIQLVRSFSPPTDFPR